MNTQPIAALVAAGTALAALAFAPTTANVESSDPEPPASCNDTAGREVLTAEGVDLDVAAPAATAPELLATSEITGEAITPHRTAHFFYTVDAAPFEEVEITARITWEDTPSDYDLYGYTYFGDQRTELGTSNESNIDGGDTRVEEITATVDDCQRIDLELRSWAGSPAQDLRFQVEVTPLGEPVEGRAARAEDDRRALYLAGDRPGNLGTPADTVGDAYPFRGRLSTERPTANVPNATTRPVLGSTIERNPLQPWWDGGVEDFPTVTGSPSALVWLSSPSQQQDPGAVLVQLFLNGQEHAVEIPGEQLTAEVRPFLVEFPEVDTTVADASLQVSALPVVSPNTQSEHTGDANHTVWFDSVQYQSRLFLPVVEAAEAAG